MKLTRKKAIELCIELWTWLAKTGKENKEDWPGWDRKYAIMDCFFCEYAPVDKKRGLCKRCPWWQKHGHCYRNINSPYRKWCEAEIPRTRKKYAKLFLGQIKSL